MASEQAPGSFPRLGEGERFHFACQRCGECCFDQEVALEPQDLLFLGRAPELAALRHTRELFARGIVSRTRGPDGWRCLLDMPRWRRGQRKCRFLAPRLSEDGVLHGWDCSIHAAGAKPFVCQLSPVARALTPEAPGGESFYLVPPVAGCPGVGKGGPRTLDEYLLWAPALLARLAHSRWYVDAVAPLLSQDEETMRAAFEFALDVGWGLPELEAHLARVAGVARP